MPEMDHTLYGYHIIIDEADKLSRETNISISVLDILEKPWIRINESKQDGDYLLAHKR